MRVRVEFLGLTRTGRNDICFVEWESFLAFRAQNARPVGLWIAVVGDHLVGCLARKDLAMDLLLERQSNLL